MSLNPISRRGPQSRAIPTILLSAALSFLGVGSTTVRGSVAELSRALTFHASFDHGLNADFARGDRGLRYAASMDKQAAAHPGLPPSGEIVLAEGVGRFGNALRFTRQQSPLIFYPAARNVAYRTNAWSGTVSFWLRVDPQAELGMSFCDPLQITPRAWNDAAFFVEFEKRTNEIPFRLGVYPDFKVWNPQNRKWEDLSPAEKPLVTAPKPTPFSRDRWTHVVFTFDHFNTGRPDGVATLYLDGHAVATIPPRVQTFTWDINDTRIMLGIGYVGLWDELAVFDRSLSAAEVAELHALPHGVAALHP